MLLHDVESVMRESFSRLQKVASGCGLLLANGICQQICFATELALGCSRIFPSPLPVYPPVMPGVEFEMWPFRAAHGWADVVAVSICHTIPQGLPYPPNKQSFLK
jgi:hypothetical protein